MNKEITIPIKIPEQDITFKGVVFLKLLKEERYKDIEEIWNESDLHVIKEILQNHEYIKVLGPTLEEIDLREKAENLFTNVCINASNSLALQLRNLFPAGVKSGGYPVKTNLKDVEHKLKQFFKKYKYSEETVLAATKKYVEEKERTGYTYMKVLGYFILKDNDSTLATYCDMVDNGEEDANYIQDNVTMINQ